MNIIICGGGKVGFSISKQLSAQGHSVTVIDQSSEDIKKINDTQDVKGIVGRATLPTVLENAGAEKADMVIAVTRNDETNMIVCQLASSLFNISKKIARIRTKDFLQFFHRGQMLLKFDLVDRYLQQHKHCRLQVFDHFFLNK